MIEIENVRKSFGQLEVLKGINLTVQKGEVLTIIGGSGSGKSTLLMCINGLEPIQGGRILVDGVEVHAKGTDLNKLRRNIGIVFQQWNAFPHLTVIENVMLAPRKVLKKSKAEAQAIARKQLEHVGLGDKLKVFPGKLSGGQRPCWSFSWPAGSGLGCSAGCCSGLDGLSAPGWAGVGGVVLVM